MESYSFQELSLHKWGVSWGNWTLKTVSAAAGDISTSCYSVFLTRDSTSSKHRYPLPELVFLKLDHLSDSSGEQVTDMDCQGSRPGFLISQLEVGQRTCISNTARWCCSCWRPHCEAHRPKKRAVHPWQLIRIPWVILKACVQILPQTNVIRLGESRIGPGHQYCLISPYLIVACLLGWEPLWKRSSSNDFNLKSACALTN